MITFFGTGPMFGLPQASPFAFKTEVLLLMSGLSFTQARADMRSAPRGKIPWITDNGQVISDSRMIRHHLETKHGIDFTGGYNPRDQGTALAVERLCEDHLYFFNVHNRWLDPANFAKGPAKFFDAAPALLRPLVKAMILRRVKAQSDAQGTGRLTADERLHLVQKAVDAVDAILGDNAYLLGPRICGADATLFGFLASMNCDLFVSPYRDYILTKPNLVAYLSRMHAEFFPDVTA